MDWSNCRCRGRHFYSLEAFEYAKENKPYVILAFDNDKEAVKPLERVEKTLSNKGINFNRESPPSKGFAA